MVHCQSATCSPFERPIVVSTADLGVKQQFSQGVRAITIQSAAVVPYYVLGLPVAASDRLLDELWSHMERPEFIWEHDWRNGDVVMWDNRCCAHSRASFDPGLRRRLRRVTVIGERPV
jgi:alpha-ketoglutarate-dependent taurine dioxygenase